MSWLRAGQKEACLRITEEVGHRLADSIFTDTVEQILPSGIASGYAGIALYFGLLDRLFPGNGWEVTAHRALERAVRSFEVTPGPSYGLFTGAAGLAFTARYLSSNGRRYNVLISDLDQMISEYVEGYIAEDRALFPYTPSSFDIISGLAGIGVYLTTIDGSESALLLDGVAQYIERAFNYLDVDAECLTVIPHSARLLNCGLAHGQPGVLGFLCCLPLTPGRVGSVRAATNWLAAQSVRTMDGINWPNIASPESEGADFEKTRLSRTAWCYGAPGISRVLWMAGKNLKDDQVCSLGHSALIDALYKSRKRQRIDSPILCHGVAGLLLIAMAALKATHDGAVHQKVIEMINELTMDWFNPTSKFGFSDIRSGVVSEQPGLLAGAAGVGLVLGIAATAPDPKIERLFLIS